MKARAVMWTNPNGQQHCYVNTLSPGKVAEYYTTWSERWPESKPHLVEVEIRELRDTMRADAMAPGTADEVTEVYEMPEGE